MKPRTFGFPAAQINSQSELLYSHVNIMFPHGVLFISIYLVFI